ncbi:MAG TPA: hypothetical protein V6D26_09570 [Stenomitos sp.]
MSIETKSNENLFPTAHHQTSGFTQEEMQNIQRFADEHGIQGAARIKLFILLREIRANRGVESHPGNRERR